MYLIWVKTVIALRPTLNNTVLETMPLRADADGTILKLAGFV